MSAHTPGPWRVAPASDYADGRPLNVDAGTRGYVCEAGFRGNAEAEANARLIAAAPRMLATLREVEAGDPSGVRAAIVAATGEEP